MRLLVPILWLGFLSPGKSVNCLLVFPLTPGCLDARRAVTIPVIFYYSRVGLYSFVLSFPQKGQVTTTWRKLKTTTKDKSIPGVGRELVPSTMVSGVPACLHQVHAAFSVISSLFKSVSYVINFLIPGFASTMKRMWYERPQNNAEPCNLIFLNCSLMRIITTFHRFPRRSPDELTNTLVSI
jgi:hypothetical protein